MNKSSNAIAQYHDVCRTALSQPGLLLVALAAITLFLWSCKSKEQLPADPDVYYTCSMDPQVISHKPGSCPICKMDLTPVKKNNGENNDELQLSEQQVQLGNIQTDTIRNGSIGDQLVLTATLNFDQMKTTSVSSRVMGRVEKLYYKALGDYVKKGVPLYDLYSEELNNARQEYLLAIDKRKAFSGEVVIDFDQLIQSARNKLLLWGMTQSQIDELAKTGKATPVTTFYSTAAGYLTQLDIREGDYVMEGGTIIKLADLSTLWAEAQVYTSQLAQVSAGSVATVQLPDFEGKEIKGRIEFMNPEINPDTRVNLVRVTIPNTNAQLRPGMPAYVLLKSPVRNSLTLPIDAVIRDAKGATVWTKVGKNTFKSVMVETGLERDDRIEIRSGLQPGDVVVLTGAYLLHSEYVFKKGSDPMAGHNH
ncbi:MAG: efflux RND transporter periplasmic adaptor subunit [Sphingobacteriales bacterium]|nr:efflux RND transporter periplasmic adaptor subunit [Sphingobacteriales bacterium]